MFGISAINALTIYMPISLHLSKYAGFYLVMLKKCQNTAKVHAGIWENQLYKGVGERLRHDCMYNGVLAKFEMIIHSHPDFSHSSGRTRP